MPVQHAAELLLFALPLEEDNPPELPLSEAKYYNQNHEATFTSV